MNTAVLPPFTSLDEAIGSCTCLNINPTHLNLLVTRLTYTPHAVLSDPILTNPSTLSSISITDNGLVLLFICPLLLSATISTESVNDLNASFHLFLSTTYTLIDTVDSSILQCAPVASRSLAESLIRVGRHYISSTPIVQALVNLTAKFTLPKAINPILHITLKFCLETFQLNEALPLLSHGKESLQHPVNIEDVLLYHYYAGFILLALKQFQRAMDYFQFNLCVPTKGAVSKIQIGSYQKLILASLIKNGEATEIIKLTPQNAAMSYARGMSDVYIEYACAYKAVLTSLTSESERPMTPYMIAEKYAHLFESHGHLGLIVQSLKILPIHYLTNLPSLYSTVSLDKVSTSLARLMNRESVSVDEVHRLLIQAPKCINAQSDGTYLEFCPLVAKTNVSEMLPHQITLAGLDSKRLGEMTNNLVLKLNHKKAKLSNNNPSSSPLTSLPHLSPTYVSADEDMDLS